MITEAEGKGGVLEIKVEAKLAKAKDEFFSVVRMACTTGQWTGLEGDPDTGRGVDEDIIGAVAGDGKGETGVEYTREEIGQNVGDALEAEGIKGMVHATSTTSMRQTYGWKVIMYASIQGMEAVLSNCVKQILWWHVCFDDLLHSFGCVHQDMVIWFDHEVNACQEGVTWTAECWAWG